jgi:hypothetical protein
VSIYEAFEPVEIEHTPAEAPPTFGFGAGSVAAGFKAGKAGTDWGWNQTRYEADIHEAFQTALQKKGLPAPTFNYSDAATARRLLDNGVELPEMGLGGVNKKERDFWALVAAQRKVDPSFMKEYADVVDARSIAPAATKRRAIDEQDAGHVYVNSTAAGKVAWWAGNFGAGFRDPLSYLPLGEGVMAAKTIAGSVLKTAARSALLNAAAQGAMEPLVRKDASRRGQTRTAGDTALDVGFAGLLGGLLGGGEAGFDAAMASREGVRAIVDAVGQDNLTPDERAAATVIERDIDVREASPFAPTPAGEREHGRRLAVALASLENDAPVPQFSGAKSRLSGGTSLTALSAGQGDAQIKARIRQFESGGDPNIRNPGAGQSASGHYQFIDATAVGLARELGDTRTDAQIIAGKNDPAFQERLMDRALANYRKTYTAAGIDPTDGDLYLAHFLGPETAVKVARADPTTPIVDLVGAKAVKANETLLAGKTAGDVVAEMDRRMGGTGEIAAVDRPVLREDLFLDEPERAAAQRSIDEGDSQTPPRVAMAIEDTRGQGVQYHGARNDVPSLTEGYYNPANIYGGFDTFYTTDAMDVASGYGRRRESARLYTVAENEPVRMFDMEQRFGQTDLQKIFGINDPNADGFVPSAIEEAINEAGGDGANLRQAMDMIRDMSAGEGLSRDEIQEVFDTAITNLRAEGFGGMSHTGGLKTKRAPHQVKIYFDAPNQLKLDPVERPGVDGATITDAEIAARVVAESESPAFTDPNGADAEAQTDSIAHDLAMTVSENEPGYRLDDEGGETTLSEVLESIAADEAAIAAARNCL